MHIGFYATTMFISAFLLSWIQPLIAKIFLPILGGSPSVWQTCMMFFQFLILLGYSYAHVLTKRYVLKTQLSVHILIVATTLSTLPFSSTNIMPPLQGDIPVVWLLLQLTKKILLPTFVVCSTAPLLQRWFSYTQHKHAHDPYFLYAASNSGSLFALLSFPFLLEPLLGVLHQCQGFAVLYGCFAALIITLATCLWRTKIHQTTNKAWQSTHLSQPSLQTKIHWCLLAMVPSSLFLGVTTAITTDIASVPLFWIMPLTIYMSTFILCFSKRPILSHQFLIDHHGYLLVPLLFILPTVNSKASSWTLIEAYLIAFFACAMICHGEFYRLRPHKAYLTQYYIWLALGGLLGGVFNVIIAPILFTTALEFPIMMVAACLLRPASDQSTSRSPTLQDWIVPFSLLLVAFIIRWGGQSLFHAYPLHYYDLLKILFYAMCLIVLLSQSRPVRFALGLAVIFYSSVVFFNSANTTVYRARNFFGTLKVRENSYLHLRYLLHGTTTHGAQAIRQKQKPAYSYYVPVKDIIATVNKRKKHARVAAIGLGIGTVSCIIKAPNNNLTFYEIDKDIVKLAYNDQYFHYLKQCPPLGGVVIGDGRLSIKKSKANNFDLILVDAFSSDAIPAHLVNLNAITLYLQKLAPNGLLAFHISNRYLDLSPVLSRIAAKLNLQAAIITFTDSDQVQGTSSSVWVVMTTDPTSHHLLLSKYGWQRLPSYSDAPLWTDDYSNVLDILR